MCFGLLPANAIIDVTLQMQLGNPSGAVTNTAFTTNYLILRTVEAISYNTNSGQANWASWDLIDSDVGNATRSTTYFTDTNLPAGYYRVTDNDYVGVGNINFNRGHLCPSEDRTDTEANNDMVFFISNIMPQSAPNNQGPWAKLETDCRNLAAAGNELLIICGPSGFGTNALPSGKALIGSNTWKVVVVVPTGSGTALSRITTTTNRVISIKVPNTTNVDVHDSWTNYITTARQIELDTGFTFFTALPGPIGSAFRARIDGLNSASTPSITSFTPTSGATNATVVITGANFNSASAVKFNGTSAVFIVNTNTQITAVVPTNATTGTISVTTPGGTVTSAGTFTVGTVAGVPDLVVACSHSGTFTQGDSGRTYTITVTNIGPTASTGTITVSNALPAGLTATAMSGTGWSVTLGTLTATRSDALAAGSTYPALTLTVSVATNASASLTNIVVVSGGGETNTANNIVSDPTSINPATIPTATTLAATSVGFTNATLNGTVNPNNQPATVQFEYGLTTNYGSVVLMAGTLSGNSNQSVTVTLTNLSAASAYHYRVGASNLLGIATGLDQSFNTAVPPVADLAVSKTHVGSFTQGGAGTYTIIVTNLGAGASAGTVTLVDTLPAGLTATAINGSGWATNLATLTCTRSDALAAGAAYPAITLTISVATNAANLLTNIVVVSGGGETNANNNTASDPTTVNPADIPTVTTLAATSVGYTNATLNGTVNPNNQPATGQFQYGLTTNYGSVALVAGTLSGTNSQAVNVTLTNLASATNYHYRVVASNLLGVATGLDQSFSTAVLPVADLVVTKTHPGSFTQSGTGTYTIIVTNLGAGASAGTVTVVDTLPAGLTATALSGTGWGVTLGTLTATRSDALAAGAAYPALTLTVSVAANAASLLTNTVVVSGGGETNTSNNTATDPTTVNPATTGGIVTLAGWDVSGLGNYGPSPLTPTTNAANVTVAGLTRGTGVTLSGTGATNGWGGTGWTDANQAAAVTGNRYVTCGITAVTGYTVSYTSINRFDYRRSGTGPTDGMVQYQVGAGAFNDVAAVSYTSVSSSGASLSAIDLSGIAALQNVGPGTNVTFRIVNWGGSGSSGSWYVFNTAGSSAPDFSIQGTVTALSVAPSVQTLAGTYDANGLTLLCTNASPGATYFVQASTNLLVWQNLSTNTASVNGLLQYLDPQATNLATRFYRLAK